MKKLTLILTLASGVAVSAHASFAANYYNHQYNGENLERSILNKSGAPDQIRTHTSTVYIKDSIDSQRVENKNSSFSSNDGSDQEFDSFFSSLFGSNPNNRFYLFVGMSKAEPNEDEFRPSSCDEMQFEAVNCNTSTSGGGIKKGTGMTFAAGLKFSDKIRADFSYTTYEDLQYEGNNIGIGSLGGSPIAEVKGGLIDTDLYMVNGYFEILRTRKSFSKIIKPYIVASVGYANVEINDINYIFEDGDEHKLEGKKTDNMAFGGGVGLSFEPLSFLAFDGSVKYLDLGEVVTSKYYYDVTNGGMGAFAELESEFRIVEFLAGVRLSF